MPDRSQIRKGVFLQGGGHRVVTKRAGADRLRAEFPLLQDVIEAAGPLPTPQRLAELKAEREALAQRLEAIRARIAELRAAEKRK